MSETKGGNTLSTNVKEKKKIVNMPHTYVLLICIIAIMALLTYIIPAGEYIRVLDQATGRTIVDPDSFHLIEKSPVNFFGIFKAIPKGMNAGATITFFIFLVAGSFQIITASGAIEAGIFRIAKALKGKEHLLIPIFMILFSVTGAFLGFSEENMIFIPIAIGLSRALGYDAMVGMSLITIGGACGFNSAMMNPFTVGVAQGIAELPMFSGIGLRFAVWVVLLVVSITYVMLYAKKIRQNSNLSLIADIELLEKDESIINLTDNQTKLELRHYLVFLTILIGFITIIFGVYKYGWYITEIAAVFLLIGIISGLIGKISPNNIAKEFVIGAKSIVFGALVVGIARGILIVMVEGGILDSIICGLSSVISTLPTSLSAVGMFLIQVVINFFIPSGSGQAAATMPIMVPIADLLGITRQTSVLAFQFGDGFSNAIIPTASTLMASLSLAHIPYEKWVKYIGKLMLIWIAIGAIFMIIANAISYGPF